MELPSSLRTWFIAHAAIDVVAAIPLLLFPEAALGALGWTAVDPAATRLCGAALLAIGGQSFFGRDAGAETYRAMLRLKVIWSLAAVFGLIAAAGSGAPPAVWAFLSIFLAFAGVWIHYAVRLKQMAAAAADDGSTRGDDSAQTPDDTDSHAPPAPR